MSLDDDIRILSGVGLFEGFTQEQLRLLAFGAETMRLPAGRELYREGDAGRSAPMSWSRGNISLFREHDGERVVISTVGPGALLGELALISDTTRLTSACAATDAEVLRLNRKMFRRILEEYPDVAIALHRRIVERPADADQPHRETGAEVREIGALPIASRANSVIAAALICAPIRYSLATSLQPNRAITGTWSEGRSQPRAARSISMLEGRRPCSPMTRHGRAGGRGLKVPNRLAR